MALAFFGPGRSICTVGQPVRPGGSQGAAYPRAAVGAGLCRLRGLGRAADPAALLPDRQRPRPHLIDAAENTRWPMPAPSITAMPLQLALTHHSSRRRCWSCHGAAGTRCRAPSRRCCAGGREARPMMRDLAAARERVEALLRLGGSASWEIPPAERPGEAALRFPLPALRRQPRAAPADRQDPRPPMNALHLASLRARIDAWLGATSLGLRLTCCPCSASPASRCCWRSTC